ncbi:hypothetical protein A9Q84_03715 [Halobacteriovorax marinus]|uniref:LysM domain-containing protein n=1 Tax=Halobacteriovorax marinus TaxID=97084 RepID=A0A1Y5FA17_9BACT|nr:hypothetical protein A9Q84_03715 [Halobacteriovorax marinus]
MGKPHIIKRGETLQNVSLQHYGTNREWPYIWANNSPLIENPNKVYAGFTIFYLPLEEKNTLSKVLEERHLMMKRHYEVQEMTNNYYLRKKEGDFVEKFFARKIFQDLSHTANI